MVVPRWAGASDADVAVLPPGVFAVVLLLPLVVEAAPRRVVGQRLEQEVVDSQKRRVAAGDCT